MSHATATPDSTAVRTALWRALHLEVDAPPHVLDDRIGLQLAGPDSEWRQRPDMNEYATPGVRASIVARARFIEDLVTEQADHGIGQYVLLGAGLDTFAQRRPQNRVADHGIRGRPGRAASMEAAAPGRTRLRHSGVATVGACRL